ncbi:spore coat protein [Brevibacillus ruminantium]|uniref:Spore coat protein n=1 Tax=Brevibacillus ruminantium TaxID=2950604 RepID=A0ABY4WI63_9BACL|nr:spore coat protein [Brevibacillus ruminantium]USG64316.1 spore coat protein [Brevibacillus ruminantium]
MQPHVYGAHEVMELHEILNGAVDAINTAQLYAPYARDPELVQLLRHQLQFMETEYNSMVHMVQGLGVGEGIPYRTISSQQAAAPSHMQPMSQMHMPPSQQALTMSQMTQSQAQPPQQPNTHPHQIDDRDISSALLGLHKTGATCKMRAVLEAAHPQLRNILLQSAVNCANQAYEVWNYMKSRGYYPFVALPESAQAQLLKGYQPTAGTNAGASQQMMPPSVPQPPAQNGTLFTNVVDPENPVSQQTSILSGMTNPGGPPQPSYSMNASQIFSSPQYRQETYGTGDELGMTTEHEGTLSGEAYSSLPQAQDGKQQRGRKKGSSDSTIG